VIEATTRGVLDPPVRPGDDGFGGFTPAAYVVASKLKSEQFATISLLQMSSDCAVHASFDVT
jgi:hypothetical protein